METWSDPAHAIGRVVARAVGADPRVGPPLLARVSPLAGRPAVGLARFTVALAVALLPVFSPATAHADALSDLKARIAQAQSAVKDLTSKRQGQQQVVEQLRGVTGAYATDLRKVDMELIGAMAKFRQAEADLERVEEETVTLEGEIAAKEEAVQQRAGVYGTRLRALYKFTRTSPLEQLLAARSFSDALHRITMMQAVTRVDNRLLGQLRAEQNDLLKAKEALAQKLAEAAALRDELDAQRRVLEERRQQQAVLVGMAQHEQRSAEVALSDLDREQQAHAQRITSLQAQYQRELEELERQRLEEQRRQEELRRQEEQRRAQATAQAQANATATAQARAGATATPAGRPAASPTATPRGGAPATPTPRPSITVPTLPGSVKTDGLQPSSYNFVWPVRNPLITTEYGERNFAQSYHTGIDLATGETRVPVYAVADGKVLESGLAVPGNQSASYGMMVVIAHDTKLTTLYAHLDVGSHAPTVKVGDSVKRGQVIGYVGMTGITSGPHLHFEVRESGQHRDPRKYLPK